MMGKTHQAFAVLSFLVVEHIRPEYLGDPVVALGCVMVGALLPDLDSPESSYGRLCPWLSKPLHSILGHRTLTHSLAIMCAFFILMKQFGDRTCFILPLLLGYASHIVGDMLIGNSGVGLFWPIKQKVSLNPFGLRVGGFGEYIIFHLIVIAGGFLVLARAEPIIYVKVVHQISHWINIFV